MYQQLTTFEHIYKSYTLASKSKRNEKEVINFSMNLAKNLWDIQMKLEKKTFAFSGYHRFYLYEPKKREIDALKFKDRIVQHCLCDYVLEPYFEKRLIYDNAACRVHKGTHFAMKRLTNFLREYYRKYGNKGYVLKYDIRKYFQNINHTVLKDKLKNFPDEDIKKLLYEIIDGFEKKTDKGIPMGNQTSQWFALYYLDGLDRLIKEKLHIQYYSRYMDDGILVHQDKEYLKECLKKMKHYIQILDLEFNEKTQIFPIAQGVDYLGFRFYLSDSGKVIRRLRTSTKKRYKKRMKVLQKQYAHYEIELEDVRQSINSYKGHLKHGHTYKLSNRVISQTTFIRKGEKKDEKNKARK